MPCLLLLAVLSMKLRSWLAVPVGNTLQGKWNCLAVLWAHVPCPELCCCLGPRVTPNGSARLAVVVGCSRHSFATRCSTYMPCCHLCAVLSWAPQVKLSSVRHVMPGGQQQEALQALHAVAERGVALAHSTLMAQ